MKRIVLCALAMAAMLQLAGCNTMAGFGKDMQAGGQSLENAASKK
jgi:predicted small secreted protein